MTTFIGQALLSPKLQFPRSNAPRRVKRVQKYIGDEPFMLTYGDGVSDVDLNALLNQHHSSGASQGSLPVKFPYFSPFLCPNAPRHTAAIPHFFQLWGEPTVHPDFVKFLQWAYETGMRKYFCTNGMRLEQLTPHISSNFTLSRWVSMHCQKPGCL